MSAHICGDAPHDQLRDGPCLTALREHTVVRVEDVRTDGRWPDYLTAATSQGIAAILGVPVDSGEDAQARLDLCFDRPGDVDSDAVETVRHEVVLASKSLRLAVRLARHREAETDLAAAMASRTMIDPAVGNIMGQNRCPQQEAFEILKAVSRHRNVELRRVAADLVATVSRSPEATTHFGR